MSDQQKKYGSFFAQTVAEIAATTMSQITGGNWHGDVATAEATAPAIAVCFAASGAMAEGSFTFELGSSDAVLAARTFVGDDTPLEEEAAPNEDENEALDELLRQIAGAAATALRPEFGRIELRFMGREPVEWPLGEFWSVTIAEGEKKVTFSLRLSQQILDVHEPAPEPVPEKVVQPAAEQPAHTAPAMAAAMAPAMAAAMAAAPSAAAPAQTAIPAAAPSAAAPPQAVASGNVATPLNSNESINGKMVQQMMRDGNLNILLDLEMDVTLRFGRRQMLMKDILELCSGSVIELDRMVQEPVDLLIDNKIIAKGEVVIVNGNYGLRVTEVATPQQKIDVLP
jgi:flagellar motor switch protein FliN/FliY